MIYLLRLVHILAGAFWVGAVFVVVRFLMPSFKAVGPAAAPVMAQITQRRKMPVVMMTLAVLTIVSGLWLMKIVSAGATHAWMQSSAGRTFSMGGGLAILGALLGMTVTSPAMRRIGKILAAAAQRGSPPTAEESAEIQRLQARAGVVTNVVAILLVLATAAMAVARYVP